MTENIEATVLKYEKFINNVLKEDLKILEQRLMQTTAEISDLNQQQRTLIVLTDKNMHPHGFKTQMNLGCNFFMEASVLDTSKMLINIGLNHFLEFNAEEANKYLGARIKAYEKILDELLTKTAQTKAHIKLMLLGLNELQSGVNSTLI